MSGHDYIVMAYMVMAYVLVAQVVMAHVVMAYLTMAHLVMALGHDETYGHDVVRLDAVQEPFIPLVTDGLAMEHTKHSIRSI